MHPPLENAPPASATPEEQPPSSSHGAAMRWLVVLAAVALVAGPLLAVGGRSERARWRMAAAREHWLNGDLKAALADLDAAVRIAPDYPAPYAQRAQMRIDAGQYAAALEDAEKLLKLAPRSFQGIQLKADALLYLGRAKEAARVWVDFAAVPKEQYELTSPTLLNGVAYYRALANEDLETAAAEVNAAIAQVRNTTGWEEAEAAFLDTRGHIHFLRKNYQAALKDLNLAVATAERQRSETFRQATTAQRLGLQDPRLLVWQRKQIDRTVAVIRYHRGLIFEALDHAADAERDFRRVRTLGFEPGPSLF